MITWTLIVMFMGAVPATVLPNSYPTEELCKGAAEFIFESTNMPKDQNASKWFCVPSTQHGDFPQEEKRPGSDS